MKLDKGIMNDALLDIIEKRQGIPGLNPITRPWEFGTWRLYPDWKLYVVIPAWAIEAVMAK